MIKNMMTSSSRQSSQIVSMIYLMIESWEYLESEYR